MQPLERSVIEALGRGALDPALLETAGEADPARAGQAFREAAADPDLAACLVRWVPELLRAARPGFGAQCLAELARRVRETGTRLDLERLPLLPRLVGCSNFLARLLLRRPGWLEDLEGAPPGPPPDEPPDADWSAIRLCKYRGLLRIAARDLAGRPLVEALRELSDLADRCLATGLVCAAQETGAPQPALLALGKLGGRELNFSSDVDLLFLSNPPDAESAPEHNRAEMRLIRRLKAALETPTEEGFGYRVDLDLRPEGPTGILVNSVEAALGYYESYGAEWERQMLIRLRPLAGPAGVSEAFARGVEPFVYRRLIDPTVLDAVRAMKNRIESERRSAGRDLEADLKEGPGGIRDVEFLVQSLQLFHGGREPGLRSGNVLDTLDALGRLELLPPAVVASLQDAYTWLRRAEHAVQLVEEQQTASFPRERAAQIGLARRLGYAEPEAESARARLLDDWTSVRAAARAHFEALVLRPNA